MQNNVITVKNLKMVYDTLEAVKGINFYVESGKLFAFLGPNGAGKSTTIDILCTLLKPCGGEVIIDGYKLGRDDDRIRESIGVVFQDSVLDPLLTVRENLVVRAHFYNMKKKAAAAVEKAAAAANVTEFVDRPYGKLSGGQRRRADIARALINTPKVLFLDEPTTGLDPKTKEGVWQTIFKLQRENGMTVFLTTHYMEEAAFADYIIIMDHGRISAKGTPIDLQIQYSSDRLSVKPKNREGLIKILEEEKIAYREKNSLLTIDLDHTLMAVPILEKTKNHIDSFEVIHGSMDDVFLTITGGKQEC